MAPVNAKPKPRRQTAASAFTAPLLSSFVSCFVVREHPALPQPNTGGRAGPAGLSISQAVPPQEGRKEPWEDGEKPLTCGQDRERRLARMSAEDASQPRGLVCPPSPGTSSCCLEDAGSPPAGTAAPGRPVLCFPLSMGWGKFSQQKVFSKWSFDKKTWEDSFFKMSEHFPFLRRNFFEMLTVLF